MVRLAQSASTHFNKPVVTRQYARVLLGRYDVELEQLSSTRTIQVKVHAENATGFLQQVGLPWFSRRKGDHPFILH